MAPCQLIEIKNSSKRVVHQALSNIVGQSSVGWWNFKMCDSAILISLWVDFIYKINDHDASFVGGLKWIVRSNVCFLVSRFALALCMALFMLVCLYDLCL
jgi:hypothetical protein